MTKLFDIAGDVLVAIVGPTLGLLYLPQILRVVVGIAHAMA